jgi:hypothetical protein
MAKVISTKYDELYFSCSAHYRTIRTINYQTDHYNVNYILKTRDPLSVE